MTELGRAYGSALYALAEDEKQEDAFLSQLGEVCKLLDDNPDYVRLIKDRAIAKTERLALLDGAFSGQIHPYLLNFMKLLCERGAFGEMAACQAEYISCYNEKHGIVPAKVFSAEALSDEQLARLKAALERTSGKHVTLDVHVDAVALVGGMRVEMAGKAKAIILLESRMDHRRCALAARTARILQKAGETHGSETQIFKNR